jgi:lipopolysaccharide heptosyltransferase II
VSARLLAIRPRALGDVVLTEPALRALRRGHPEARIDVLTEARYAPLLEPLPEVDRVLTVGRGSWETAALGRRLRGERYERVIDFFGNPRSAFLTAASGARATYGWDLRGRRYAYRTVAPRNAIAPGRRAEYAAAAHVRLAVLAGAVPDGVDVRLERTAEARARAHEALARAGVTAPARTVGLVPAGTWASKTWPLSHFAALARALLERGWPLVAILGPGEEAAGARLAALAPGIRLLPPLADTLALAAAVAELAAVVGTDSGPRHLAAAFGVPTFAWFGPADPELWTPDDPRHGVWWTDLPCRACNLTRCSHWSCLPGLAPRTAVDLVTRHLERHVGAAAALDPAARA